MKTAYFDCFSGVSGNMIIGALIDAGLDQNFLKKELKKIPLGGYEISVKKIKKAGLAATHFEVLANKSQPSRFLKEIKKIISASRLAPKFKNKIIEIFEILAAVESKVHGIPAEKVHFHEIGAVDTIIDVSAAVLGFQKLGIEKIFCSALNLGAGFVKTGHGRLPVPAPATAILVQGLPVYQGAEKFELTTPTGAVIIKYFAEKFGPLPEMTVLQTGAGAGTRELKTLPNILRVFIGEISPAKTTAGKKPDEPAEIMIEFNVDDASPQIYETLFDTALKNGALDIFLTPIQMKKNRPAVKVSLIAEEKNLPKLAALIFKETPTFGLRHFPINRIKLQRRFQKIKTPFGPVTFKIGLYAGQVVSARPEYEEIKKISRVKNLSLRQVLEAAQIASARHLC